MPNSRVAVGPAPRGPEERGAGGAPRRRRGSRRRRPELHQRGRAPAAPPRDRAARERDRDPAHGLRALRTNRLDRGPMPASLGG